MKRRKSSSAYRRERMILAASSVLVLTAMTVTGVYIYNSNQAKQPENNVVDFSAMENEQEQMGQITPAENSSAQNLTSGQEDSGELDYDPFYAEADQQLNAAGELTAAGEQGELQGVPGMEEGQAAAAAGDGVASVGYAEIIGDAPGGEVIAGSISNGEADGADGVLAAGDAADAAGMDSALADAENAAADAAGELADAPDEVADASGDAANLHFSEANKLEWPLVGNVLLNYSMDKTIYFPTLQQYKYNPSIVISATQGTNVACAADGVVTSIHEEPQLGTVVVMNLGDGYELTYGQLQEISVEEGDLVETGVFIGKVAAPTKYYTSEGTNVYFKLTKDGEPVNPLHYLG